jgi:hypothetical protein
MSDDLDIFRHGIRRFRYGGVAVAVLPLVLGISLMLSGGRDVAMQLIIVSVIVLFLVLWATLCAEEVVAKLQAARQGQP